MSKETQCTRIGPGEDFVLLLSGIADNDRLVKRVVKNERPVYYKSRYVAPYEEFRELKKLLLQVRSIDDVNAENVIAIDLNEWVGHEQEEYFTVLLKYLHDQRDHWRYVFTAGEHTRREVSRLYIKLKTYMTGDILEDETFRNRECLHRYLMKNIRIQRSAANLLSDLFFSRELASCRGYEMLESVIDELDSMSGGRPIGMAVLKRYLSREDALLCLLLGKTVEIEEGKNENY